MRRSIVRRAVAPLKGNVSTPAPLPWATETVYIIGGGPSAGRVDLAALCGIVIGVNDSAIHAPRVDVVFSASPPWIRARLEFVANFPGLVVLMTTTGARAAQKYHLARPILALPLRDQRSNRRDHNSGHEALCWAADMGATFIVLIGFDMDPAEPVNWHPGYEWMPDKTADPLFDFSAWAHAFQATALDLKRRGVTVRNANPASRLRCFPFMEITARCAS